MATINYDSGVKLGIKLNDELVAIGVREYIGEGSWQQGSEYGFSTFPEFATLHNPTDYQWFIDNHYYQTYARYGDVTNYEPFWINKDIGLGYFAYFFNRQSTITPSIDNLTYIAIGIFAKNSIYINEYNPEGYGPISTLPVMRYDMADISREYYSQGHELEFAFAYNDDSNKWLRGVCGMIEQRVGGNVFMPISQMPHSYYQYISELYPESFQSYPFLQLPSGEYLTIDNVGVPIPDETKAQGGFNDGSYDTSSDTIDFPSLPSVSATSSGMVSIFRPSELQVQSFAEFLWSDDFNDQVQQNWIKPTDMIISSHIVPINLVYGESRNISIGGIDSGIAAHTIPQYVQFDCGSITVDPYYANFLDFMYSKIRLYIPFVSFVELSSDDVMGATLSLKYNVDLMSGDFIAMLKCTKNGVFNSVNYSFTGNMATAIPITSVSFMQTYQTHLETINSIGQSVGQILSGDIGGAVSSLFNASANEVMGQKAQVNRGGGGTVTPHYMGVLTPYLIIERPIVSLPKNYNAFNGYVSNITRKLSDLKGYTVIDTITFDNMDLTTAEREELLQIVQNGVYL